ncbi:hypothetical protein BsWGS_02639 [Bradybaena similaris]
MGRRIRAWLLCDACAREPCFPRAPVARSVRHAHVPCVSLSVGSSSVLFTCWAEISNSRALISPLPSEESHGCFNFTCVFHLKILHQKTPQLPRVRLAASRLTVIHRTSQGPPGADDNPQPRVDDEGSNSQQAVDPAREPH